MKIQVATDRSVDGTETLAHDVEGEVRSALERYASRLSRVEVHLSEEDGDKNSNDHAKRCLLEARPEGMQPVVVTGLGDNVEHACHDATSKMLRLLDSTFGRIDGRDAHATIRHTDS